jgi:type II secretory pathway pseudopilin PulG
MMLRLAKTNRRSVDGFTLIEVLIAFGIFTIVISGLIFGYVQANRMAEWASLSLAAQSYASQGMEQARSAQWNSQQSPYASGLGTGDELPAPTNYSRQDVMDVPTTGAPVNVTNFITITTVTNATIPASVKLRQIQSDVYWTFPLDGKLCTNTAITLRAPDQ